MLTKLHHVTYVVNSVKEIEDYFEKNFALKPERNGEFPNRKWTLYRIGDSLVDFFEPNMTGEYVNSSMARQLREQGPGVMHVAWGVNDIGKAFKDLEAKGNKLKGIAPRPNTQGYMTFNIDESSSHGLFLQLAEGDLDDRGSVRTWD